MTDSAAVLKLIFDIPASRIAIAIDAGWLDPVLEAFRSENLEVVAEEHHKSMVRAKHLQTRDLTEAVKIYLAFMDANGIAELAVDVAFAKGRLADLDDLMKEARKRDGLADNEHWQIGEGPEDYQKLSNESEELIRKIHDTVISTVFRRYHLSALAELFENDRAKFDQLSESGRKEIFGEPKRPKRPSRK